MGQVNGAVYSHLPPSSASVSITVLYILPGRRNVTTFYLLFLGLCVVIVLRMCPSLYLSTLSDWKFPGQRPYVPSMEPLKGSLPFPYSLPSGHVGSPVGWGGDGG